MVGAAPLHKTRYMFYKWWVLPLAQSNVSILQIVSAAPFAQNKVLTFLQMVGAAILHKTRY